MAASRRQRIWLSLLLVGIALLATGIVVLVLGYDRADQLASVAGGVAGLLGLGLAAYATLRVTRDTDATRITTGQRVERVTAGENVDVVDGVHGNVRLGGGPGGRAARSTPAAGPPIAAAEQSVVDARARRSVRVVREVGGDVDLGR